MDDSLVRMLQYEALIGYSRTCMLGELFKQLISIPILRNVANKESVVVKRYRHTKLFSFPQFEIIQLKMHRKSKLILSTQLFLISKMLSISSNLRDIISRGKLVAGVERDMKRGWRELCLDFSMFWIWFICEQHRDTWKDSNWANSHATRGRLKWLNLNFNTILNSFDRE